MKKILRRIDVKVLLLMIVLILPMNIIFGVSVNYLMEETIQNEIHSGSAQTELFMQDLENRMENTVTYLFRCKYQNHDCMEMMDQPQDEYTYINAKIKFGVELRRYLPLVDCADGCFFYMKQKQDWMAYPMDRTCQFIYDLIDDESNPKETHISRWKLLEYNGQMIMYIIWNESKVVYGAWFNLSDILKEMKEQFYWESVRLEVHDTTDHELADIKDHANSVGFYSDAKNIRVTVFLKRSEILAGISLMRKVLYMLAILYIVLIPVLCLVIKRILIDPLRVINAAHEKIQNGNSKFRIIEKANSEEYEQAYGSFNKMADSLYNYKIESYEHELEKQRLIVEKQKLELMNLQLQIRPHFLLNTFNLIYTLVQKNEKKAVQDIIIYLSDYFRYLFRSGKKWELFSKEMDLIQAYIHVSSIRYQNRVSMVCEIDPEIEYIRVPPLLIHNFIENAVKYGIKEKEELHILFVAEYEEGVVTITIANDGNEMDEECLERNQRIFSGNYNPEEENRHLGLYNSYQRLKSIYGESAGISLKAGPGVMTQFVITFSYDLEWEGMDESSDN